MIKKLQNFEYDTAIFPTDWRYSASLLGIKKYLDYYQLNYRLVTINDSSTLWKDCDELIGMEGLLYNRIDISEEKYLLYVEKMWDEDFQHIKVERILSKDEYEEDDIKIVNGLLYGAKSNTILRSTFKGIKFDGYNDKQILDMIEENRLNIIKETYKNKLSMYKNYANMKSMFSKNNPHCRLLGYNLDKDKKSKSASYSFNKNSFVANDYFEFDFIPLAFSKTGTAIFINNNYSVELLEQTYNDLNQILDNVINQNITTASLLKLLSKSAHFVRYDVEIIMKERNDKYYKTVYLRESAINAMNMIGSKIDEIKFTTVIGKDYWLNVQEEVAKACLNGLSLDSLIERMLKIREGDKVNKSYVSKIIRDLIEFDFFMKGDIKMDKETKYEVSKEDIEKARKCAFLVAKTLPENKVNAYRQKLISALVFHDYDRVCEILLQLSGFSGISMPFAYKLYENPEENKSIAFSFANGLEKNSFADKQFKGGI